MSIRDLILHNFRRKLFALLLAILIWLTIHFADKRQRGPGLLPQKPTMNSVIVP